MSSTTPLDSNAPWGKVARTVFWNRDVSLERWRNGILKAGKAYLPESVRWMRPQHFIRFLGRDTFVAEWPRLRRALEADHPGKARLDLHWSVITSGTFNANPDSVLLDLPGRSREAYEYLVRHQGVSVYELAKGTGIPYRRAHDHVKRLADTGLLQSRYCKTGARTKRLLYTLPAKIHQSQHHGHH